MGFDIYFKGSCKAVREPVIKGPIDAMLCLHILPPRDIKSCGYKWTKDVLYEGRVVIL